MYGQVPVYVSTCSNSMSPLRIITKFGKDDMPLDALQFRAVSNNNMAGAQTCEVGATLAP